MRQPTPPGRDYQPDPFELQIGSMVVFHRATLLHHDRATHDALIRVSNDYLWYGQYLEKLTGATPPWDPGARNETTPPELFPLETEGWVGHTQSIPKPSFGGVHRHFRLVRRADAHKGLFRPTPDMAHALAVVEVVQHPDERWQVLHAEVREDHRRRGIATMLYDRIEILLDTKLGPSGWLSENAYQFWQRRHPELVQWHRKHEHLPGLWVSPKTLLNLLVIAQAKLMQSVEGGQPN
jgi:hypothetical protein